MITSESIYKALLTSLRKEKRGRSITPDDVNESIFPIVNRTIWNKYSSLFEEDQDNSKIMGPFKVFNETLSLTSGRCILPVLYDRLIGLPRTIETISTIQYTRNVDIVTSAEWSFRQNDYLTQPTETRPVCVLGSTPLGSITAVSDYSGTVAGTVRITSAAHGLSSGHIIIVSGTTSYNGLHTITKIDANSFYFTATYVNSQTGTWTGQNMLKISIYPTTITSVNIDYLRMPVIPFLDYYVNDTTLELTYLSEGATHVNIPSGYTYRSGTVGGSGVYVDSTTINFEWDDSLFNEILAVMQQMAAIQLQDTTLISNNQGQ